MYYVFQLTNVVFYFKLILEFLTIINLCQGNEMQSKINDTRDIEIF